MKWAKPDKKQTTKMALNPKQKAALMMAKKTSKNEDQEPIVDSTNFYKNKAYIASLKYATATGMPAMKVFEKEEEQAKMDAERQKYKGKKGYDNMGFPVKK